MLLGAVLFGAVPALAQDGPPPGGPPGGAQRGQMMAKMLMSLNPPLSDKQKAQIIEMRKAMEKQNASVTDRDQRRANMKAFMDKINGVLTPAQQADLKKKRDEMRAKYESEHPGGPPPGGPN
jgi:Spy/CpxP family protein refolding chaperone